VRLVARPGRRPRQQAGYALVALVAAVTIMLVVMAAAVPSWRYVMKNEREEELIFRGNQIARAIEQFQKKRGNLLPSSLDLLVKEKFLRRAYKDPMTKDGRWRMVRPGEPVFGAGGALPRPGGGPTPRPTPTPTPTPSSSFGREGASGIGPFSGVASRSNEKSLRLFNNQDQYDRWLFVAGQPRIVGKPLQIKGGGGIRPDGRPGGQATPAPATDSKP
jgi:type II secretory pathway pseudopilin PulG